jgi:hypothetical protein
MSAAKTTPTNVNSGRNGMKDKFETNFIEDHKNFDE